MEFRILGSIEIRKNGNSVPIQGTKALALLALLVLERNRVVTTDRLIDALWEEGPPPTARNTVQVYVSRLRKSLAAVHEPDRLHATGTGYRLRAEASEVDAAAFEELTSAGRAALADDLHDVAAAKFSQALALWGNTPLFELAGASFAQAEAARLDAVRLVALEGRIETRLALGLDPGVIGELEALVAAHPLHEGFRRQLMVALYRVGRQADALDTYWALYCELRDGLGIAPSMRLQRLQQAILRQDPELDTDLAVSGWRRARAMLPVPVNPLIGRAEELRAVAAALSDESVRLLTVTGHAGVGKTRFAIEVARLLASELDAVVFVDLQELQDAALVSEALERALAQAVGRRVGDASSDRRLLLVLDNFEHVLAAAPAVATVLAGTPGLTLLVTSRAAMRIAGEHEYPLKPLSLPTSSTHGNDALLAVPSVALFAERARAVNSDFSVTAENSTAVADICIRLDGLPLAIELAAARSNVLSPHEMLRRLQSRLALLTGGVHDGPARQQTLRAAIDWGHNLLAPDEQRLFARIAVFAGGASLDSIESVCGHGFAAPLDLLESLVAKSMLHAGGQDERRFEMLETLREYALERLASSGEESDLRRRHAAHYLELFASKDDRDGADESRSLERMEQERRNIRAALEYMVDTADGEAALLLATATRRMWRIRGYLEEGRWLLGRALGAATAVPSAARLEVTNTAGILAAEQGDFEAARRSFEDVVELADALGSPERAGSALSNLGNLAFFEADYPRARSLYEASADVHRGQGDRRRLAVALENLAAVSLREGDVDTGIDCLGDSIALAREAGANETVASSLRALARELLGREELEQARELLVEAFELSSELGDPQAISESLDSFAILAASSGEAAAAALLVGAADAQRARIAAIRPPDTSSWTAEPIALARDELGDELFVAAYDEGRALAPRQAIDRTLPVAAGSTAPNRG